ncbi:D-arabinose 5-phosphate isomerase [Alkalilimnicola ehrlichii]|uniref:Arabinose 5-phosphate isomerase n=2 Tax=Alkalilimnicola ehrlichii TaxID=351052 RepID=A0A3E0WXY2_9GAMM|nr:D-arabinose 5-phosphate isomerase [Alkalilimnicola ehrlichii]
MEQDKIRSPLKDTDTTSPNARVTDGRLRELALAVLATEADAVESLKERIDETFTKACRYMLACEGRVVVTGMGKSGHIGNKVAATLASTGTPAFFVHPGEASHGDLGMITPQDVVLALSNSGETEEMITILPLIKRLNVPLIALTGNPDSTLAKAANAHINVKVPKEACPLGLAPTSSTTAALAMGDALAVSLLEARGFTAEDFARSHPGGRLGRRLLLLIDDLMHTGERVPQVTPETALADALMEMSRKGLGMTAVVDQKQRLLGVFTDGDLRRALDRNVDVHRTKVRDVMTERCKTVHPQQLAAEALAVMDEHKINALLVIDDNEQLVGALNMHDLLRAGVV